MNIYTQKPVSFNLLICSTGIMTVFYQRDSPTQGFNATFIVQSCPDHCPKNKACVEERCRCAKGFAGPMCDVEVCPNNCSFTLNGRGECNWVSNNAVYLECTVLKKSVECT